MSWIVARPECCHKCAFSPYDFPILGTIRNLTPQELPQMRARFDAVNAEQEGRSVGRTYILVIAADKITRRRRRAVFVILIHWGSIGGALYRGDFLNYPFFADFLIFCFHLRHPIPIGKPNTNEN